MHKVEMGNIDGLRERVSAELHGNVFKKFDRRERERVEEVGAAVLVNGNWKPVKAQAQAHVCKA